MIKIKDYRIMLKNVVYYVPGANAAMGVFYIYFYLSNGSFSVSFDTEEERDLNLIILDKKTNEFT